MLGVRDPLRSLGPGIVTGVSDNDPAGISTYSIAGASAGYAFLWLMFITSTRALTEHMFY